MKSCKQNFFGGERQSYCLLIGVCVFAPFIFVLAHAAASDLFAGAAENFAPQDRKLYLPLHHAMKCSSFTLADDAARRQILERIWYVNQLLAIRL